MTTSVMARDIKKTYITYCPTYGLWFELTIIGMHKWMEDELPQNQAVNLDVVHKLMDGFEDDYCRSKVEGLKEGIVNQDIFVLVAFLAALQGKEVF